MSSPLHQKSAFSTAATRVLLSVTVCLLAAATFVVTRGSAQSAPAAIATSQKLYSVGETMIINGTGFSPNANIYMTVLRPDHATDSVLPLPLTNGSGGFTASYTPPLIPGRYTITATDGSNTAVTAVTEADAIGYNKGVYDKSATAPEDTTGHWTTGNAGSNYLENQWSFYQYEITGVGSTVPSFDVTFNHFQPNTNAVFIDALADFRACIDCTDSTFTSGPSQGMLLDTDPLPPSLPNANWVVAASAVSHFNRPLNTAADGSGTTVLTGSTGFCSSDTKEPIPDLVTTFPAQFHCFHVDGPTLGKLFGTTLSSGTHTITLYYAAHLAASFVWGNGTSGVGGHEGSLGDCNSPFYVHPLTGPLASFEPISTTTCVGFPVVYGTDDYTGWTAAGFGVGFATGSSRHFSLSNQSAGSSGSIDLPIPTVAAPQNTIIIRKATVPANTTGVTFPFTSSLLGNFSLTSPFPSSKTFTGIAGGVEYDVTENSVAGWTLNSVSCAVTAGTDDGTGTWPTSGNNPTAAITLGGTDSGVTLTCTYTNSGSGHIIVQKHTNPAGSLQSFAYTTTGTGYTGFSLTDGGSNTDGGTPPAGGLTPGSYSISENSVTGWVLTSRTCSLTTTGSGTSTFPASGTTQPASITLGAGDTVTCVYNNTQPDAKISITPQTATNAVGSPHTFTATVQQNSGSGFTNAPDGTTVTFSLSNNTAGASFVGGVSTCTTTGGSCSISVNSTTAGSVTIQATTTFSVLGVSLTRTTGDGVSGDSPNANKTWVDLKIAITPQTATNAVGSPHTFTATVQQNPGTGFVNVPDGTSVTFSLSSNTAGATFVGGVSTCTTTTGSCSVSVNGTTAGSATVTASATVSVSGVSLTRTTGDGLSGDSPSGVKTWVDARITLTPLTAVNEVGSPHTFTATVQQNSGSGFTNAPDGTTVTFSLLSNTAGAAFVGGVSTCTTTGGSCSISVNSTSAGSVTIQATTTFSVLGVSLTRTTGDGLSGDSANASKTWVDLKIAITPQAATNAVGSPHTFTATVQQNTGSGFANVPDGTSVTFSLSSNTAGATFVGGVSTCTTTGGSCSVSVNGTTAGSATVTASATVSVSGVSLTRTTGDGLSGDSPSGVKTWVDARITLTPLTAVNEVGSPHTFTATVQQNSGSGFTNAPDGTTVTFSLLSNTAGAAFVGGVSTCTTTAGVCSISVNAPNVGSVTIRATTTFNVLGVSLTRTTNDGLSGDSVDAVKHWVDANITIGPATAKNEVNSAHTFTITVTALPNGTGTPTFGAVTATVTPAPSTLGTVSCAAPVGNVETCTLTINSTTAGTFTANAQTTVTMGGVTVTRATNDAHVGDVGPAVKIYIAPATTLTVKTPPPASVEAGASVTIVLTETNTGSDTLTNVNVTGGGSCSSFSPVGPFSGTLAPGASQDFSCTFTAAAGPNAWSALGHGTDSLNNPAPATNESQSGSVNGVAAATQLTVKTPPPASVEAGASVTIVVTETNTGNGPLTNVNVTGSPAACATFTPITPGFTGTLAAGASADFSCTFTAVAGPNAWSALGHGTDSLNNPAPAANESQSGSVNGVAAATQLTVKTPPPASVEAGASVTIVVTETNTGNGPLTNVNVTGSPAACATFTPITPGFTGTLAAGASADFSCTFTAVAGPNAWSAMGHGTDSLNNPAPAANESQSGSVNGVAAATQLTVKTPPPASVEAGASVTIVVTETNTGNGPLTNVNVTGSPAACATFTPITPGFTGTLAAGASADFSCTFTAVAGPNAWSALGHGTDSLNNPAPATNESQSGSVNGVAAATQLTVKTAPPASVEAGASVTIVVTETNTGNGPLMNVNVTGSPAACATFTPITPGFTGTLAAGASADFSCTFTAVAGPNAWSAMGHGTDSLNNPAPAANESQSGSVNGLLSKLVVVKHTVGGNGTFQFAATGADVPASFTETTSGGTATAIFAAIHSGPKSVSETVPAGWLGNTTNVACTETTQGITPSVIGTLTTGEVAAGGAITANVSLGIGATVECDFTNALLPTLTIVKTIQGTGTATFTFPVTGDNTLNPTITPPTAPSTATYPPGPPTPPPGVVLNVGSNGTTSNNTISESGPPAGWTLTDFTCTGYTGGGTGAGSLVNGVPTSWNFIASFGDNVVCTFVNNNTQATRTQGFWATHTVLTNEVWGGNGTTPPPGVTPVTGSPDAVLCGVTITALPTPPGENVLLGGFWANISHTSAGKKRLAIDQARMQMLQQYLAAVLNVHMFGSGSEQMLADARTAYCGTNASAIQAEIGILGTFNSQGDTLGTTPGGSATAQASKSQADIDAWDIPLTPID